MSDASDTSLRMQAEADIARAQAILGGTALVSGVEGDSFWSDLADRARKVLQDIESARQLPMRKAADAARAVRDAARRGLQKGSDAAADAKGKLAAVAASAGMLAMGPGILLMLAAVVLVEGSGWGRRVRRAGRRYVDARARAYGI